MQHEIIGSVIFERPGPEDQIPYDYGMPPWDCCKCGAAVNTTAIGLHAMWHDRGERES